MYRRAKSGIEIPSKDGLVEHIGFRRGRNSRIAQPHVIVLCALPSGSGATYLVFFRLPRTSELMLCWRNFRPHLRAPSIIQTRGTLHRALSTSGYPPPTSPCPPANHTSWTSCLGAFFFGNGLPQYSSPAGHRSGRNIVRLP